MLVPYHKVAGSNPNLVRPTFFNNVFEQKIWVLEVPRQNIWEVEVSLKNIWVVEVSRQNIWVSSVQKPRQMGGGGAGQP